MGVKELSRRINAPLNRYHAAHVPLTELGRWAGKNRVETRTIADVSVATACKQPVGAVA